ncbi:MAG TPA: exodeoxyribonuclease I [Candidatus Saccharimonadales bacterium]|nr:exodeoxyribonuclease I [Candidatus Saccharimonadales bacterium]
MTKSIFFYDLETSGISSKADRIMQFAGFRTDLDLNPVGEPVNQLIKLTPDVLPDPEAVLLTGITPQKTLELGMTEHDFLKIFHGDVATADTMFCGFNNVRFDDEFVRYLNYRNYCDPYAWQWSMGRSRWDMFDVARMCRALRPDGIKWPDDSSGKPINRLEDLARANQLNHDSAHDALSDVLAVIGLAQLIYAKQPKLFSYLIDLMPDKTKVAKLVNAGQPFVHTSGKYPSEYHKTTVVAELAPHPKRQGSLVFDLRVDPSTLMDKSPEQLYEIWQTYDRDKIFPVKTLLFNRCPAVAPISVIDESASKRIKLKMSDIEKNYKKLEAVKTELSDKIFKALSLLDAHQEKRYKTLDYGVDGQLYDGFFSTSDKVLMQKVSSASADYLKTLTPSFQDNRLNGLLLPYKARNFPEILTNEEKKSWEGIRLEHLSLTKAAGTKVYFERIDELMSDKKLPKNSQKILNELKSYSSGLVAV